MQITRPWTFLAATALTVSVLGGCSSVEEKVKDTVGKVSTDAAATAIEKAVATQLDQAGIKLDGSPSCSPDLSVAGVGLKGTVGCEARTADGKTAKATFDGSINTSGCDGSLVVEVDGRKVVDESDLSNCSISTN